MAAIARGLSVVRAYQRHPAHVAGSLRQLPVRDTDSPLEGSGFELLVPRYETPEDFWSIPGILGGYGKVPPIRMRCVPQNGTASLVKVPAPSGPLLFPLRDAPVAPQRLPPPLGPLRRRLLRPQHSGMPPHSPAIEKRRWVSRRYATFIHRWQRVGGTRRPDGSRAAAATRRTASRARCRAGTHACTRRALAGSARPDRRSRQGPRGSRCG